MDPVTGPGSRSARFHRTVRLTHTKFIVFNVLAIKRRRLYLIQWTMGNGPPDKGGMSVKIKGYKTYGRL